MRERWEKLGAACLASIFLAVVLTGCGGGDSKPATNPGELKKVKIGYSGGTCEAPVFTALEKGFLKEEGLDAELVKGDFDNNKNSLATGKLDAVNGLVMSWIKPLEQGLDAKFTTGIHTGCNYVLVPANSTIKTAQDFKGKRVGVDAMGGSPMMVLARELVNNGVDYKNDVQWRVFPKTELEAAYDKGEIDAIAVGEPFGTMWRKKTDKFTVLIDTAKTPPYKDEYCCLLLVSGKLIKQDEPTAAAITRAVMKGALYVKDHPQEIGQLLVEKKYVGGTAELNGEILSQFNYVPSVDGGEKAVQSTAVEARKVQFLDPATDPDVLAKQIFVRLKGVQ
ncbi:ABC transporter substrate-binding protein [Heliophilum fasciatum]|uniref:NitT/TauT family transport system substrate-binding protein n=1 Tax=Heliophilum fasciatum TaxID=35700 RepID=A0A4V2SX86_9FIRM|nr:ABC transporter substrate-binding protein [Heliophilum fasciatum]MCW2277679.1 NitT/TauT family transport system substrate-binding protein [Heliophilum fasciatum]TCP65026.1 NitT/TauT family transport system substrate-binding protein [Heliophilum fasciatum]